MTNFKISLGVATALALSFAAAPAFAQDSTGEEIVVTGQPQIGTFGVDLTARDLSVRPGDDFEKYASGTWIAKTEIPSDRPSTGSFYDLDESVQDQMKTLVTSAPANAKYGTLYRSFMDEGAIERAGLAPLMKDEAAVRAIGDKTAFARFMGETYGKFGISLFGPGVYADTDNPTVNGLWLGQSGLGLPQKDYYFKPDYAKQRAAYQAYITRTMQALGHKDAGGIASRIMAFETEVASLSWDAADQRDITKINNPMSTAELKAYAPGMDWDAFFAGANIPDQNRIIVNENSAIKAIAELYDKTDLDTLKLWQEFHVADQAAPYLDKAMVDSRFEFTKSLSGVSQIQPRWKRGVSLVNGSLGELVGTPSGNTCRITD